MALARTGAGLAEVCPRQYYLSRADRADRRERLRARLWAAGLREAQWFPAVPMAALRGDARGYASLAKRSCALSKRLILRLAASVHAPALLFLEDDVRFHPQFEDRFRRLRLPEDWGVIFLGGQHMELPEPVSPGLVRVRRAYDHHALMIRGRYFREVRRAIRGSGKRGPAGERHCDVLLAERGAHIPMYAAYPNLAWQGEERSDLLGKTYSSYHPGGRQIWEPEGLSGLA